MDPIDERILLRESLELAFERDDDFPQIFYDILFHRHPELEPLFRGHTPNAQRVMFGQTLVAIVDHADDPTWLDTTLTPLARSHVRYGVTDAMYDLVGDCLVASLAETCVGQWSPAHDKAWRNAYQRVAATMRKAATEVDS